ncbi:MAG: ABC transporter permease, partial [Bacteroidota bacterium]
MLKNYLKTAWRNVTKSKVFSFINIAGLSLGMASSLLIILWIKDEYSVDAFHANKNQLYRIYERQFFSGKEQGVIWTQGPLAAELKKAIPEIEMSTAFSWSSNQTFTVGDKVNKQSLNTAGKDFFKMFSFPLLEGNAETALNEKNSFAISRKMAGIFFGGPQAAIGKTIRYDNRKDFTVTAVFEDIPRNSTLQFDCLQNWDAYLDDNKWATDWESTDPLTFFQIRADANPVAVAAKLKHFPDKFIPVPNGGHHTELAMQPFHEYYLNSNFKDAHIEGGRIEYVHLFSFVAIFILLIACINYMNLATARSSKRAKEVGIRKVVGAGRSGLITQFMGESLLITTLSAALAIALLVLVLPFFNGLTDKHMILPVSNLFFWLLMAALLAVTGLIAGSYPAIFLSSLQPIRVLKGLLKFNAGAVWFRKGLVVFQFMLSIFMIIGMLVINKQVAYTQSKNLGYNRENLVYFPLEGNFTKSYNTLQAQINQLPGILSSTIMGESPVSNSSGTESISWPGSDPNAPVRFTPLGVGYDFVKTMDIQLAAGRDFSKEFGTDSSAVLINETAVKAIGFKGDPIGQQISWGNRKVTIIGVLKDFHFQSLHNTIRPFIANLTKPEWGGNVVLRMQKDKVKPALAQLEKVCKVLNPVYPFTYSFADEQYHQLYRSEQIVGSLSDYFAALAILVACLGLFGLASFTAEQRTKEIGIRKVLGASITSVTTLLSKDFFQLIVLSFVIAAPLAWYFMNQWLQNFAYKINIGWWV